MRNLPRELLILVVALTGGFALNAQAQSSRCADCHIANAPSALPNWSGFALRHLQDWDASPHSRHNVGCDRCHGGNPAIFEKFLAHKDMLPPSSPASPANAVNLPKTCGGCHTGPFVSFQKSKHYQLLQAGDTRGPHARRATARWRPTSSRPARWGPSARSATAQGGRRSGSVGPKTPGR